jgi:hypothetical protein
MFVIRTENDGRAERLTWTRWTDSVGARGPGAGAIVTWSTSDQRQTDTYGRAERIHLKPGETLRFGFSRRLGTFNPRTQAVGGLAMGRDVWALTNFTADTTFVAENLEGGAELVKVPPRRVNVVIPFEMSRIFIPAWPRLMELTVFGTQPALLDAEVIARAPGDARPGLDEQSKYFLVLVALCEPRLRGSSMAAVPSVHEVIERLRGLTQFKDANRSSINYHVDYLRERKLPVEQWAMSYDGGRLHSKREALVAFALRYDIVREEHLRLLPPRRARGTGSVP